MTLKFGIFGHFVASFRTHRGPIQIVPPRNQLICTPFEKTRTHNATAVRKLLLPHKRYAYNLMDAHGGNGLTAAEADSSPLNKLNSEVKNLNIHAGFEDSVPEYETRFAHDEPDYYSDSLSAEYTVEADGIDKLESTNEYIGVEVSLHPKLDKIEEDEIEISVTDSQYEAICHPPTMNQIFRISAGPGSGKTFTLVARVAQLLNDGAHPDEILVLSMANRSVESVKSSLSKLIGPEKAEKVEISTFHSFCAGLLEEYGSMINSAYTKKGIFDETTWKTMIAFFLGKTVKFGNHSIEGVITPSRLGKVISDVMLGNISAEKAASQHKISANYVSSVVEHLKKSGMVRYDELISEASKLMKSSATKLNSRDLEFEHSDHLIRRLAKYRAVFVDEFQDVYPSLAQVVQYIVEYPTFGCGQQRKHLTITGDPNQSIYEFLGTSARDMLEFHTKLPGTEVVDHRLMESFRCTQPILDAAVDVSLKDPHLQLTSMRLAFAQKPTIIRSRSPIEEFHKVADEIVRLIFLLGGLVHLDDIAILTKTNDTALAMQSVLKSRYGFPSVKLSLGNRWVSSKLHILKEIVSVIVGDTTSSVSLMAVLLLIDSEAGGKRRVSKLFSSSIGARDAEDPMFLETYIFDGLRSAKSPDTAFSGLYKKYPAALSKMASFLNEVQNERAIVAELHAKDPLLYDPVALVSCLQRMAGLDGIAAYLGLGTNETSKASPLEVLESFNDSVHNAYGKYCSQLELQSGTFLDYFLQSYDSEVPSPIGSSIKVSTIHSAKGLEFPIVFILGQSMHNAAWDKVLADEYAPGAAGQASGDMPLVGQSLPRECSALDNFSLSAKEITKPGFGKPEIGSQENSPAPSLGSVSRLLYVALSRARNLVYVGCRKPFEALLTTTQSRFTEAVPVFGHTDGQENVGLKFQSQDEHTLAGARESPNSESDNILLARDNGNPRKNEQFQDKFPERGLSPISAGMPIWGLLIDSFSADIKRPLPARQKMDVGLRLLGDVMRKHGPESRGIPAYGVAPRLLDNNLGQFRRPTYEKTLQRSARQIWNVARVGLHKRAA